MFDGIFWDNDGVLMETEHLYYQANAEALAGMGVELTLEEFCLVSLRRGESTARWHLDGIHQLPPLLGMNEG